MTAIQNLCERVIVLDDGGIIFSGKMPEGIARYISAVGEPKARLADYKSHTGTGDIRIKDIYIRGRDGQRRNSVLCGEPADIVLEYENCNLTPDTQVWVSVFVRTEMEAPVFLHHNRMSGTEISGLSKRGKFVCSIESLPLCPAAYSLTYSVLKRDSTYLDGLSDACKLIVEGTSFKIAETPPPSFGPLIVEAKWSVEKVQ